MNATPVEFAGRPTGFYSKDATATPEEGLKLVSLKRPESVASTVAVRCTCGVKTFLVNGVLEAPCFGCGKVVSILKK